ncbi:MAG: Ig-like domain-containing protein [Planctomycetota bacterium]
MDLLRRIPLLLSTPLVVIALSACGGGGGGGGGGNISGTNSTIAASATTGTLADGTEVVTITVTVRDTNGDPVAGQTVELAATGTGNTLVQPGSVTNANGQTTGTVATTVPETKTVSAVINPGANEVAVADTVDTEFVPAVSAANSTVAADPAFGTLADGTHTTTITVTVEDVFGVPAPGQVVEIASTGTGNILTQPAGATNASGVATGTLASTVAELKTLSAIVNPGAGEVAIGQTADAEFVWQVPQTYFVRKSGSDANDGESPAAAWATIAHAAGLLAPGDTVHVGAGTYAESITISAVGAADAPIFLLADTNGNYTSDAGDVVVDAGGGAFGFHFDAAAFAGLRGFTVTGAVPGGGSGGGIWIDNGCTAIVVSGCIVYGNDRGIHLEDSDGSYLENNRVSNNRTGVGDGIVLSNGVGLLVQNNLIYNNSRYGLRLLSGVTGIEVRVNTLYANGGDQVRIETGCQGFVEDNIITDGLADGIDIATGSFIGEDHNIVWNHVGLDFNDYLGGSLDPTSQSVDPLYVDPNGADNVLGGANGADDLFLVSFGSLSVDAGDRDAATTAVYFGGALTGFTTRDDGFLDGSAPDGATVNLGYHESAQTGPIGTLSTDDARLFYGSGEEVTVRSRIWDENTLTWLPPATIDPVEGTVKWVISKVSPLVQQEELLGILSDTGTGTELSVRLWNGRFWSEAGGYTDPIESQIPSANANQRAFDLAYEDLSGHAMVVYSNNTNNPVYRTHESGVWSPETPVFASPPGTGTVLWVEVSSRPGTDELALVCLSDQAHLSAVIWDGAAWDEAGTATLLDTSISTGILSRAFDLAYETASGDLLVVWGHTNLIEEVRYAVKLAGSGTFNVGLANSAEAIGVIVRLAPDPGGNRIACALSEGALDTNVVGMIWDGAVFTNIAEFDLTGALDSRDISVSWIGTTGTAVFIYKDDDGAGTLDWAKYTDAWHKQTDAPLPGIGDMVFIQGLSFPNKDKLMVLMSDEAGSLFALTYDGVAWTITNGGTALETSLPELGASSRPFNFALKK